MEFKVGDRVIGTGEQSSVDLTGQYGTICEAKGKEYAVEWDRTISSISNNREKGHTCEGKVKNGYGWYTETKNLKKVDMGTEFKIGDRVRGIVEMQGVNIVGRYGTVCNDKSTALDIEWDDPISSMNTKGNNGHSCNGKAKEGHGWSVYKNNLELVKTFTAAPMSTKLNKGDRVICNGKESGVAFVNQYGTVVGPPREATPAHYPIEFDTKFTYGHHCDGFANQGHGYWCDIKILTKVTESAPPKTKTEFKVGDRVRGLGSADGIDINGKCGTICIIHSNDYIGVNWDEPNSRFHDCDRKCIYGHGWNVNTHDLELIGAVYTGFTSAAGSASSISGSGYVKIDPTTFMARPAEPGIQFISPSVSEWSSLDIVRLSPAERYDSLSWSEDTSSSPAPSPYLHKEPVYVGKTQHHNTIIHNKQIDDFLLLN